MLRVAFLVRSLEFGGAERQLVTLAKALDPNIFQTTVVCLYGGGQLEQQLKDSKVQLLSLGKKGRWDIFVFLWKLIQTFKHLNPDIVHGYLNVPNLLAIFLKPLLPSTRMIWGVRSSNVDLNRYNWLSRLLFKLECFFSCFADLIIVNSKAGCAYHLAHGFPDKKMVVIPNGIDTELFQPDVDARAKVRAEWGILESTILIGLVGRLDPMKDHTTFLTAAALLLEKRQDTYFVCVGTGHDTYIQEIQNLANQLNIANKVLWAGARSDMPAIQNALDIATSASSYGEGFSNVIGEAMACGVPCVVTDVGDSAWIVGDIGIVVQPQNPEALVAGWLACLEQDRNNIARELRSRIIENFSVQELVKKTETAIVSLLNNGINN